MRHFKTLALRSTATLALLGALSLAAQAQVTITEDTSDQILTSTAGDDGTPADVTVETGVTVTVDSDRSGIILDSDNDLVLDGEVRADDIDGATGVELGGVEGSYTQTGSISIVEDFTPENTDDDPFPDGGVAVGEGRTGILISGASPFQGNVELAAGSLIDIEGNDSFGINLANTPMTTEGLTGNLTTGGQINVTGDRSIGVNLAHNIVGDVSNTGIVEVTGEGSQAYVVSGDIDGGFSSSGRIAANAFRFTTREGFAGNSDDTTGREDLTAEDLREAGSALEISGNVTGGIFLNQAFAPRLDDAGEVVLDEDGNPIMDLVGTSSISQLGSAPAVLIGGDGSQITIGLVAPITDPDDPDFDGDLQYGFINQGSVTANGVFDDFDATTLSFSNVTVEGGINNEGTLSATTFRAPNPTDLTDGNGVARVLVLGGQSIAQEINNSGVILATASEAVDEVFFDQENIIPPRDLLAVAIDIGEGATVGEEGETVGELINTGAISAVLIGREGTAVAIRDASGTVTRLSNTGVISTVGSTSDPLDAEDINFDLIAIDFSAATNSIEINQSQNPDATNIPLIIGDVLLGSGDDSFSSSAGQITGAIDFGGGNDTLALSGGTIFTGDIRNTDSLDLSVIDGSTLTLASAENIQISEARVDGTSTYRPVINGASGQASTLISDGNITFETGATIDPIFESIIGSTAERFELVSAGNLSIGDLASLGGISSSFLFDTNLALEDANTLVVTVDLRDPTTSVEDGGLGLDAVQAAAFGAVVDGVQQEGAVLQALNSNAQLGNAFSNISEATEFYDAFNQVLPEFSGAAKQFILANVDGAVGAVASHLDTTRRSPERPGGAWLEEFFYFADRERAGLSEQYRGDGFGFTGGIDTEFGPFHAVGVSLGFASTEVEDVVGIDEPLDVVTYQAGAYAGLAKNGFNLDLYAGGGVSDFEQNRLVSIGDFIGGAQGEWQGTHANGSVRAGYEMQINDKYWVRPSLSLDYLYLNEDGRTETGTDGIRLRVDGRNSDTASATALLDFGARFQGRRTWIRPSLRVGYRNEFISDPVETAFRFQGLSDSEGNVFDSELARLRAFAFPDQGLLLGFTVAAGSEYSSIGFDFDSDIRDGFIRHTGRIVIRLLF